MRFPGLTPHAGKESNRLKEVEAAIKHSPDKVRTEHLDPSQDSRETLVLPVLKQMPIDRLVAATGMHKRNLFAMCAGEWLPHPRSRRALIAITRSSTREHLRESGINPRLNDLAGCAACCARTFGQG